jgi:hypothetical protein
MTYEEERRAHPEPLTFRIETRVPSKWLLVDQETGEVWALAEGTATAGAKGSLHAKRSRLHVTVSEIDAKKA